MQFQTLYLEAVKGSDFIPDDKEGLSILLNVFLIDKSIYEISYELNNRPDWVVIPMQGIKLIMKEFVD